MDVMKVLHREEKKLQDVAGKIGMKLSQIRAAIHAMSANGHKSVGSVGARVSKLRGKKLSAKHRAAIRAGIRKAQAAKA
jgi:transcription elongation factor